MPGTQPDLGHDPPPFPSPAPRTLGGRDRLAELNQIPPPSRPPTLAWPWGAQQPRAPPAHAPSPGRFVILPSRASSGKIFEECSNYLRSAREVSLGPLVQEVTGQITWEGGTWPPRPPTAASPPASPSGGQGLAQNFPATDEPEEVLISGAQQGPEGQSRGKGLLVASVLLLVKCGQECLPGQGPLCRPPGSPSQPQSSAPVGSPQPSLVGWIRREWNSRLGGWCSQCKGPGAHRPPAPTLESALNLLIFFPCWGSRPA